MRRCAIDELGRSANLAMPATLSIRPLLLKAAFIDTGMTLFEKRRMIFLFVDEKRSLP